MDMSKQTYWKLALWMAVGLLAAGPALAATTERVSVSSTREQANDWSWHPAISADGRYVAFASYATNLVAGDTNGVPDILRHDRQTGETILVSVAPDGSPGNAESGRGCNRGCAISADGRFVAFHSQATNLVVPNTTPGRTHMFLRDCLLGRTILVSVGIDAEGNTVEGNRGSYYPSISADGRCIAFSSYSTNLIPSDTNGGQDVFVREFMVDEDTGELDFETGETTRVSVASDGSEAKASGWTSTWSDMPAISANGQVVVFCSNAANLDPAYPQEYYHSTIFVHDRVNSKTEVVALAMNGGQPDAECILPEISADGRYVSFQSDATNLVPNDSRRARDVFVADRENNWRITQVSVSSEGVPGNSNSALAAISANGRYVAFESAAANLDANRRGGLFVRDMEAGEAVRVDVASDGSLGVPAKDEPAIWNSLPSITPDGRFVAFRSYLLGLVPDDTNGICDIFVRDLGDGEPPPPAVDVTIISVVVRDIRGGGKYNITATLQNNGSAAATVNRLPGRRPEQQHPGVGGPAGDDRTRRDGHGQVR